MRESVDIVVIGGGAMGSAAAWQAAERGKSVVLLEQFEVGHHHGASHGTTRNFNEAYEADDYLDMLVEARALWNALSDRSERPLIDPVGLVSHGDVAPLRRVRASHERFGIASEFLSSPEAADRWPAFRFRSEVLHIPGGGRVRAEDALATMRLAAESAGARFLYSTPARAIDVLGADSVLVTTDDVEYVAQRVVVTVGAWTNTFLRSTVPTPSMLVTEEHPAHFRPLVDGGWPSFNHSPDPDAREDHWWPSQVYGMRTPGEGIKVGWHGVGEAVDPDARPHRVLPRQIEALQRYVSEWIPGVDPDTYDVISCTYTMTDDEDFVLDRSGPVVVGAGFSGHGFKFTPVIGRMLADLADDKPTPARFRRLASMSIGS